MTLSIIFQLHHGVSLLVVENGVHGEYHK